MHIIEISYFASVPLVVSAPLRTEKKASKKQKKKKIEEREREKCKLYHRVKWSGWENKQKLLCRFKSVQ